MRPPAAISLTAISGFILFLAACAGPGQSPAGDGAEAGIPGGAPRPRLVPKGRAYAALTRHTFGREGADASPSVSPDAQWLAFASTRNSPNYNLFLKSMKGAAVIQLTADGSQNFFPRFAPDGKRLAFASDRNGNWDIFVLDLAAPGTPWQVTFEEADEIAPSWSPDGKMLAYAARSGSGDWEIWTTVLASRAFSRLGPGEFPQWSPEGDRILFQKPRYRGEFWYGLWTVSIDGARVTELVGSDDWAAMGGAWSPDGKYIAFATVYKSPEARAAGRKDAADDLWIVRADGLHGLCQLTSDPPADYAPAWGTDGRIYFVSDREGGRNVWSLAPLLPETALEK